MKYDRKVTHDWFKNRYTFVIDRKNITLVPFIPKKIYEYQMRMKKERDKEKENEKRKKRKGIKIG